jgi:hypothetical protein
MAKATKGKRKLASENAGNAVSEPQAVYARKVTRPNARKPSVRKGYDAKRSAGMLPGIAERMKDYLKSMRDGR